MPEPHIVRPPAHIFERSFAEKSGGDNIVAQTVAAQANVTYVATNIDIKKDGIFIYYKDLKYPTRGWPFPEALWSVNTVKRHLMSLILSIADKSLWPVILVFLLLPKKNKIISNFIYRFTWTAHWSLAHCYLQPELYSPCCIEIRKFVEVFLKELNIEDSGFGKVLATLIEYDNAYRYRIEDIMGETSAELLLHNPQKELKRILSIYLEREKSHIEHKFQAFGNLLIYGMYIPKVKRAFIKAVQEIKFQDLQLDIPDRYHCLIRDGYDYLGLSFEERYKWWVENHKDKQPEQVIYN